MFVPDEIWVTANFKETQLDRHAARPAGRRSTIDAYPDAQIHGHVDSVQPGSGTAFSLLPAQNATGNYVKIVQRVPVKIIMDDPPTDVALGPGMSVVPTVRVDADAVAAMSGWEVAVSAVERGRTQPRPARRANPWLIAVVVAFATFMEVLDTTIANVALPLYRRRHGGQRGRGVLGGDDLSGRQRHHPDGQQLPRQAARPQDASS